MIEKPEEVLKVSFPRNNYCKYYEFGKKEYDKYKNNEDLTERIKNLSKEQVDLIADFIKDVVYE